ncbi:hypothetical protein EHYA_04468 [Embleya hyalina]|uniref:Uncharacterized protein n=1 Tax=Embleya hyalina TaxID=516124 RepID=A0A401YQB2_9ACTN|nr:hypothetical protein EHYA_04468 [Embleya hyalina]
MSERVRGRARAGVCGRASAVAPERARTGGGEGVDVRGGGGGPAARSVRDRGAGPTIVAGDQQVLRRYPLLPAGTTFRSRRTTLRLPPHLEQALLRPLAVYSITITLLPNDLV